MHSTSLFTSSVTINRGENQLDHPRLPKVRDWHRAVGLARDHCRIRSRVARPAGPPHNETRAIGGSNEGRMQGKNDLRQRLAVLLREAERAHGDYEKALGHRDDDWPDWYAAYIAHRLSGDVR